MPWIPREVQRMKTGVSIATRKFPVQFPAVVMETATPRTSRGYISLVTTQAIGLKETSGYHYMAYSCQELITSLPPAVGKVEDKETDEEDNDIANSFADLLIFIFLTNSESHNEASS